MRAAGILLPVYALPSEGGIGTLGGAARRFVDFLHDGGQRVWQVLPLGPTGFGDSPYQCFSAFAGNPYFIDLDALAEEGLLEPPGWGDWSADRVDYGALYETRPGLLRQARKRFYARVPADFEDFCARSRHWLEDYALYTALKKARGGAPWSQWPEEWKFRDAAALALASRELREDVACEKMVQYLFFRQWTALRAYARSRGVALMGDMPLYVAYDSADVWAHPRWFQMDETLTPRAVAGVPPDPYAENGQVWGNPLFDWDAMAADGYLFWRRRVRAAKGLFDYTRIDHFRGFDSYCAIPYGEETAHRGVWKKGPGMALFDALREESRDAGLIAEDLGILTPSVHTLLRQTGIPGMKVLQFAFADPAADSAYLPHHHVEDCVVYTGTHDNDTILGWYRSAGEEERGFAREYLRLHDGEWENWGVMKAAWGSVARLAIVPMQDVLSLGSEARTNTPGTLGGNWSWRLRAEDLTPGLAAALKGQMALYGRWEAKEEPHHETAV